MRSARVTDAALMIRCSGCSNTVTIYPGDETLLRLRLCPACYLEMKYPRLERIVEGSLTWGVMVLAALAVGAFAWVMWVYR